MVLSCGVKQPQRSQAWPILRPATNRIIVKIKRKVFIPFLHNDATSTIRIARAVSELATSAAICARVRRSRPEQLARSEPRRRNRRRVPNFGDGKTSSRVIEMHERLDSSGSAGRADHVDLRRERLQVCFFFDRFRLVDDATERTRVRTVKCFGNCVAQRSVFRIIDDHRCPGDGLQRHPLQTDCAANGENRNPASNAPKHSQT